MCLGQKPPSALIPLNLGHGRPVTVEDVQQVHVLIEGCIKRCFSREQTVSTLAKLGVDPRFTALVWRRLEDENPEFFATYRQELDATATLERLQVA